jgi:hypothetical protein
MEEAAELADYLPLSFKKAFHGQHRSAVSSLRLRLQPMP